MTIYRGSTVPGAGVAARGNAEDIDIADAGNIIDATEVETALQEIVTNQNTDEAALTAHIADTTTHGTTGDVVGTTDAQSLTNKTIVAASNTITTAASGNLAATELDAALAELDGQDTTNATNLTNHLNDTVDAHDASAISNVPAGGIVATDVQSAIDELDTDKVPTTRTLTAGTGISGGGDLSGDRSFALDINGLTSETTVDPAADYVAMYDTTAGVERKVLVENLSSVSAATETTAGVVELATQAEVDTGSDTSRVITPATLWGSNFGGMDLVATTTVTSAVASVDFTSINTAEYDNYVIVFEGVVPATGNVRLDLQLYVASVLKTSGYLDGGGNAEAGMGCSAANVGNLSSDGVDGAISICGANNSATKPRITNSGVVNTDTSGNPTGAYSDILGTFQYNTASTFDGFRFLFSSGNIAAGTITVYGRRK